MCLILFAYDCHPEYHLVVAANRDEYYSRPTARAGFWEDCPGVLAGRDLERSGTWLGITRKGRFAALTNYRDPASYKSNALSRGMLVKEYLCSALEPPEYIEWLRGVREAYNGFNLLLMGEGALWYYSNRGMDAEMIRPGIYGLSNRLLDTPWPKVVKGKEGLRQILGESGDVPVETLFDLLSDRAGANDEELPDTGVSLKWERLLSAVFIESDTYGTRASTVITVQRNGGVVFAERSFGAGGVRNGGDMVYHFDLR
ncbi:MAG: NRDE family protein [Bacillota bacterium]